MVVSGSSTSKKAQQRPLTSFFSKNGGGGSSTKKAEEGPSSPPSTDAAAAAPATEPMEEQEQEATIVNGKKVEETPAAAPPAAKKGKVGQEAAAEAPEVRERRSKKKEDKTKVAPAAPAPTAAEAPKAQEEVVEEEGEKEKGSAATAATTAGEKKRRIKKVVEEEDSDDDDVLGEGSSGKKEEAGKPAMKQGSKASSSTGSNGDGGSASSKKAKTEQQPKEKAVPEPAAMEVDAEESAAVATKTEAAAAAAAAAVVAAEPMDEEEQDEEEEEEEGAKDDASAASASVAASSTAAAAAAASSSSKSCKSALTITSKGKGSGGKKGSGPAASTKAILAQLGELQPGTYASLPYRTLTDVLDAVEAVSGRLEITDIVRALLAKTVECCPADLPVLLYLLCGNIYPAYQGAELGIGDKILFEALKTGLGASHKTLQQHMGDDGDLGLAAQKCKAAQRTLGFGKAPKPLTCKEVLTAFREISACSGGKSQDKKIGIIRKLLLNCAKDGSEVKFLVRGLQTKLRCKLAEPTVLTALAQALVLQKPAAVAEMENTKAGQEGDAGKGQEGGPLAKEVKILMAENSGRQAKFEAAEVVVKQAYSECPNYDELVSALLSAPLPEVLKRCRLQPGVPVKPMLAKAQDSFQEVLKRMQGLHFTMEYKYDGERAQVHKLSSGEIKVFSRNSEDTTGKYPDVVSAVPAALKDGTTSFVIDAEAVAIDPKTGKLLPFQILSTRKRKAESEADIKVQVILYAFDILYLNDRPVLQEPLIERRKLLREAFQVVPGKFEFAISLDHHEDGDTSPIEVFLDEAVQGNCEGLMIKTLEQNATYEPTKRSLNWLKLKKDYLTGANGKGPADSLDLVVIGGYHGKGKRTGWFGAFLLACYDPEAEEYQSVCKIGTGFSEEFLTKVKPELDALVVPLKPSYYNTGLDCDVWFEPKTTWEVRAADLSKSSTHKGALHKVENGKGIALRFPRFIRERTDKACEDATTAEQVADAYRSQALVESTSKGGKEGKGGDEEDDDDWCI